MQAYGIRLWFRVSYIVLDSLLDALLSYSVVYSVVIAYYNGDLVAFISASLFHFFLSFFRFFFAVARCLFLLLVRYVCEWLYVCVYSIKWKRCTLKNFKIDNILGVFSFWRSFLCILACTTLYPIWLRSLYGCLLKSSLAMCTYIRAHTNRNEHCVWYLAAT